MQLLTARSSDRVGKKIRVFLKSLGLPKDYRLKSFVKNRLSKFRSAKKTVHLICPIIF